jgi:hypothetical protein
LVDLHTIQRTSLAELVISKNSFPFFQASIRQRFVAHDDLLLVIPAKNTFT